MSWDDYERNWAPEAPQLGQGTHWVRLDNIRLVESEKGSFVVLEFSAENGGEYGKLFSTDRRALWWLRKFLHSLEIEPPEKLSHLPEIPDEVRHVEYRLKLSLENGYLNPSIQETRIASTEITDDHPVTDDDIPF